MELDSNQGEEQYVEESETSDEYVEIIEQMAVGVALIPENPIPDMSDDTDSSVDVNKLMQSGYRELYEVIQWSKSVPGFKDLCLEDQMTLLKTSFMDLNVFRLAYRSIPCDPMSLRFNDKLIYDFEACIKMGWSKDLTTTTLEFCGKLRNLNIDVNEFACLSGLVLLSPGKYVCLMQYLNHCQEVVRSRLIIPLRHVTVTVAGSYENHSLDLSGNQCHPSSNLVRTCRLIPNVVVGLV